MREAGGVHRAAGAAQAASGRLGRTAADGWFDQQVQQSPAGLAGWFWLRQE